MLSFAITVLDWLPKFFDWLLAPAALILLNLAVWPRARFRLPLGFMIAAAASATFLSIESAALLYVCGEHARVILDILLDFRPAMTASLVFALLNGAGAQLVDLVPMLATAAGAGVGAYLLRRTSTAPAVAVSAQ
jgi:hypothetical protein